eukprot:7378951-Prymnesium_polylepis.1
MHFKILKIVCDRARTMRRLYRSSSLSLGRPGALSFHCTDSPLSSLGSGFSSPAAQRPTVSLG